MIMKKFYRFFIAVSAALSCCMPSARAQDSFAKMQNPDAFLDALAARTSSVTSITASVRQEKFLSVFSAKVISTGTFAWENPDKICLDYANPAQYRIVINGDRLLTVNAGKSSTTSLKGNPVMSQMRSLMSACMTGNLQAMGSGFRMEYYESSRAFRIEVTPESSQVKGYIAKMVITLDKDSLSVNTIVMYENETDYTKYVFTDKKFNQAVPDTVFAVR